MQFWQEQENSAVPKYFCLFPLSMVEVLYTVGIDKIWSLPIGSLFITTDWGGTTNLKVHNEESITRPQK